MSKTGVIMDLNEYKAVVFDDTGTFINLKRNPQMFVGQVIQYDIQDQLQKSSGFRKYALMASGAAALFILLLFAYTNLSVNHSLYAYIDIDINPSLRLQIDEDFKVIALKPLNDEAESLSKELNVKGRHVNTALSSIIDISKQLGFIKSEQSNIVLISASLGVDSLSNHPQANKQEQRFSTLLNSIKTSLDQAYTQQIKLKVIKISEEDRKLALQNNLSMGKYKMVVEAQKQGITISFEDASRYRVSDIIEKLAATESGFKKETPDAGYVRNPKDNTSIKDSKKAEADTKELYTPHPQKNDKNHRDTSIPGNDMEFDPSENIESLIKTHDTKGNKPALGTTPLPNPSGTPSPTVAASVPTPIPSNEGSKKDNGKDSSKPDPSHETPSNEKNKDKENEIVQDSEKANDNDKNNNKQENHEESKNEEPDTEKKDEFKEPNKPDGDLDPGSKPETGATPGPSIENQQGNKDRKNITQGTYSDKGNMISTPDNHGNSNRKKP